MRNRSLPFIRFFFTLLCVILLAAYTTMGASNYSLSNLIIGGSCGLALGLILIGIDLLLSRYKLKSFNTAILGLFFGYLMGKGILLVMETIVENSQISLSIEVINLVKTLLFLATTYLGLIFTVRSSEEFHLMLPFISFKETSPKRKDTLIDWSVLTDSRIIDITASGLLDDQIIVPRFMVKELYAMLENNDESIKIKARRCIEVLRKLESMPSLEMRYSDIDYPEIRDNGLKLVQLATSIEANILTTDAARFQPYVQEKTRIINIQMLSSAIKPMVTGEQINIKIQRYGKEARQGVGYLDDGTMVVINGGAEYIGETVKAQVLSVKHTSSGRMIFCNVMDEDDFILGNHALVDSEEDSEAKSYFTL